MWLHEIFPAAEHLFHNNNNKNNNNNNNNNNNRIANNAVIRGVYDTVA